MAADAASRSLLAQPFNYQVVNDPQLTLLHRLVQQLANQVRKAATDAKDQIVSSAIRCAPVLLAQGVADQIGKIVRRKPGHQRVRAGHERLLVT